MPEQGPDWFLVATEASGIGTPSIVLSEFFRVYGYIWEEEVRRWTSGLSTRQGARPGGVGAPPYLVASSKLPWLVLEFSRVAFLPKITSPVDFVPF